MAAIDSAYDASGTRIYFPDKKVHRDNMRGGIDGLEFIPLRGYAHVVAVKHEGKFIGWGLTEDMPEGDK